MARGRGKILDRQTAGIVMPAAYEILSCNGMVCRCIIEMVPVFKDGGENVTHINLIEKERRSYESMVKGVLGLEYQSLYADMEKDYAERFEDDMRLLLQVLTASLMGKHGCNAENTAHVYRLRAMCELASKVYKQRVHALKSQSDISSLSLSFLDIGKVYHLSDNLAERFGYYSAEPCPEAQRLTDRIIEKISNSSLITKI